MPREMKPESGIYGKDFHVYLYREDEHLGRGAFGDVYKYVLRNRVRILFSQKQITDPFEVAVKVPREGDHNLQEKECKAMIATDHENIVTIYGKCQIAGKTAVVMEVWGSNTLAKQINREIKKREKKEIEMSIAIKKNILRDLLAGLQHLHERGIIHRDVKPNNVLLKQCGKKHIPKLCDFGLSKEKKKKTNGNTSETVKSVDTDAGTPGYKAPEVVKAVKDDDVPKYYTGIFTEASDIYSLGVTGFELLTLEKPDLTKKYQDRSVKLWMDNRLLKLCCSSKKDEVKAEYIVGMAFFTNCLCELPGRRSPSEELQKHAFLRSTKTAQAIISHQNEIIKELRFADGLLVKISQATNAPKGSTRLYSLDVIDWGSNKSIGKRITQTGLKTWNTELFALAVCQYQMVLACVNRKLRVEAEVYEVEVRVYDLRSVGLPRKKIDLTAESKDKNALPLVLGISDSHLVCSPSNLRTLKVIHNPLQYFSCGSELNSRIGEEGEAISGIDVESNVAGQFNTKDFSCICINGDKLYVALNTLHHHTIYELILPDESDEISAEKQRRLVIDFGRDEQIKDMIFHAERLWVTSTNSNDKSKLWRIDPSKTVKRSLVAELRFFVGRPSVRATRFFIIWHLHNRVIVFDVRKQTEEGKIKNGYIFEKDTVRVPPCCEGNVLIHVADVADKEGNEKQKVRITWLPSLEHWKSLEEIDDYLTDEDNTVPADK